jgi:peptidoglycan/xylan/chitin deacetylase (PgdA/CDA1 family)
MIWRLVRHVRPRQSVTLVIDDGPSDALPELLASLERCGHRAVLFVLGANAAGREAMLVDAIRRGFPLGNHSFGHPHFSDITLDAGRREIMETEAVIDDLYRRARVARPGKWFRFPYLDTGDGGAEGFQRLLQELGFERPAAVGTRLAEDEAARIDWPTTVWTMDWELPDIQRMRTLLEQAQPGDVVEFHDKVETVGRYAALVADTLSARSLRARVPT